MMPKSKDKEPAAQNDAAPLASDPTPTEGPQEAPACEPRPTIEPHPGQMVDFEVTTADPVYRFGTRQPLVSGEPICWNDYYFHLWRSGCIRPVALPESAHG